MKNPNSPFVEVQQVIWSKDSHRLFDYQSKDIIFAKSIVESSSKIYQEGAKISISATNKPQSLNNELANQDSNYLFSITTKSDKDFTAGDNDKPFLVIRSLKDEDGNQKGYDLELGDIIRLGRVEYRIFEVQDHLGAVQSLLEGSISLKSCPFSISIKDYNTPKELKKQCRICLLNEQDTPEVLINPCNCKGTNEYVHLQCLKRWLNSKIRTKTNVYAISFYWKKLVCEDCKVSLPDIVDVEGSKRELIPISRPKGPYILLERVFYNAPKEIAENNKIMILLNILDDTQQIKLGRGDDSDLKENDISVSRLHAFIKYQDGHFTIFDNNSKFGTSVLLRKQIQIQKKKEIELQFGRTLITLALKYPTMKEVLDFKTQLVREQLPNKENLNIHQNEIYFVSK